MSEIRIELILITSAAFLSEFALEAETSLKQIYFMLNQNLDIVSFLDGDKMKQNEKVLPLSKNFPGKLCFFIMIKLSRAG